MFSQAFLRELVGPKKRLPLDGDDPERELADMDLLLPEFTAKAVCLCGKVHDGWFVRVSIPHIRTFDRTGTKLYVTHRFVTPCCHEEVYIGIYGYKM